MTTSGNSVGPEITAKERQYAVQCYESRGADPLVVGRALGVEVWDVDGHRFLDFTAQTAARAIGYGHPRMIAALRAQLENAVVSPNHLHPHRVELAERLVHGIASARQPYEPLLPGFVHVPPPDAQHGDYPSELDATPVRLSCDRHGSYRLDVRV